MHPNAQILASDARLGQHVLKAGVRSYYLVAGGRKSMLTAHTADQFCQRIAGLSLREAERLLKEAEANE